MIHIIIDHNTTTVNLIRTVASIESQLGSYSVSILNRTNSNVLDILSTSLDYDRKLYVYLEEPNRTKGLNKILDTFDKHVSFYEYVLFIKSGTVLTALGIIKDLDEYILNTNKRVMISLMSKTLEEPNVFVNPLSVYNNLISLRFLKDNGIKYTEESTIIDDMVFMSRVLTNYSNDDLAYNSYYSNTCCFVTEKFPSVDLNLFSNINFIEVLLLLDSLLVKQSLTTVIKDYPLLEASIVMFVYYMYSLRGGFDTDTRTKTMCKTVLNNVIDYRVITLCFDRYDLIMSYLKSIGGDISLVSFTSFLKDMDLLGLKYSTQE